MTGRNSEDCAVNANKLNELGYEARSFKFDLSQPEKLLRNLRKNHQG